MPLVLVVFICIPLFLAEEAAAVMARLRRSAAGESPPARGRLQLAVALLALVCGILYLCRMHPRFDQMFPERSDYLVERGDFVRSHIGYQDVLFSPTPRQATIPRTCSLTPESGSTRWPK